MPKRARDILYWSAVAIFLPLGFLYLLKPFWEGDPATGVILLLAFVLGVGIAHLMERAAQDLS